MATITPRLQDAKRALDAADRVKADGDALLNQAHDLAKQGRETIRTADPQYWTAAKLIFEELSSSPLTQGEASDMLGRSRGYVSKLYSVGRTFRGRDPQAEGMSFDAAYRKAQEISDYGIGREKLSAILTTATVSLTQAELAEQSGLSQSTVSEYLSKMIKDDVLQKAPGRPAKYELAAGSAASSSAVRPEHPVNGEGRMTPAEGDVANRLAKGESVPGAPGACARPGCAHAKIHHNPRNRVRECEKCGCASFLAAISDDIPDPEDSEARRALDVAEIIRFIGSRVHKEIKSGRLVLTPEEARMLIDEMSGTVSDLRDKAKLHPIFGDDMPEAGRVTEALEPFAKAQRWASCHGQRIYLTDGATVWLIIANTRAAILRERDGKYTLSPSDVSAHWLLTKATKWKDGK